MRILFISFCLLSIFTIRCKHYNHENEKLEMVGSGKFIALKTLGSINPKSDYISYYESPAGEEILFWGNDMLNELVIFNLPAGTIHNRIKFPQKGPNGIGKFWGSYIHNLDSIFIFSLTHFNHFFLTDSSGVIKQRFETGKIEGKEIPPCIRPMSSKLSNICSLKNGKINLSTYYPFLPIRYEELSKEAIDFTYNLINKEIVTHSTYPNLNPEVENIEFCRAYNGQKFVYSFYYFDDLFLQNTDGSYTKCPGRSKFRKKSLINPNNHQAPVIEQMKHMLEKPQYLNLTYDTYRNCTYRFFHPGVEIKSNEDPRKMFENRKRFSIMILDENLDIVGETMMPDNSYNPLMSFVAKDGLYIALHCDHPKYAPDSLMFERIDLKPINHD